MATSDENLQTLRQRVERLEQELAAVQGKPAPPQSWTTRIQFVPTLDLATAQELLQGVLPALLTIAKARQEAQLFVAFAEQETASGGGPEPIRWQFGDAHLEPLTRLGTAVSNASRVKLLQVLRREGESTTAALGAASGLAGGNLYQQLNELHAANLLFQPQRGKYRLTPSGRFAVDLLFYAALQVRGGPAQEQGQGKWYATTDQEERA
jgi:hypothetical protein